MRSEKFGRLLKGAIGSIVALEGKTAPVVEENLGATIGVTGASIQRYKAGHIPPEPRTVEILATAAVTRGYMNRAWLQAFLQAASYPTSDSLLEKLYPSTTRADAIAEKNRSYDNLPAPTYARFVMRQAAYTDILDGLSQRSALVVIIGIGGMGKTSLVREVSADCLSGNNGAPAFAAVVWVSDQERPGTTSLGSVLNDIAFTLDYPGLAQLDHDTKRREVENLLRRQRVLVVIDNYETITDSGLLSWLLRLPEPSKALITSREYLPEFRRSSWPVELRGLTAEEAHEFLTKSMRGLKSDNLGNDKAQLDALLAAVGGNPKALEITLGYLKYGNQTMPQIIAEVSAAQGEIFDTLFTRCWNTLDTPTQRVLLAMPLFAASAAHDALSATAGVRGATFDQALERLIDLSLLDVQRADVNTLARYAIHSLVYAFVRAKLHEQPAFEAQARERQVAWFVDLAATVGYCWNDLSRLNILDPERETIHAIIQWCITEQHYARLAQLIRGVDYYYYIRGFWTEEPGVSELRIVAAQKMGDTREEIIARAYYSQMLCRQGRMTEAEHELERLTQETTNTDLPAETHFEVQYSHGMYFMAGQNYERAVQTWRDALALSANLSIRSYAVNRGWLALCLYQQGALAEAYTLWNTILHDAGEGGFVRGVVSSQIGLTRIHLDKGESEEVRAYLAAAYTNAATYQDRGIIAEIDALYARYYLLRGEEEMARQYVTKALDVYTRLGMRKEGAKAQQLLTSIGRI